MQDKNIPQTSKNLEQTQQNNLPETKEEPKVEQTVQITSQQKKDIAVQKPQGDNVDKVQAVQPQPQEGENSSQQGAGDNESNWTDATESVAADDDLDIMYVDDDMLEAMDNDDQDSIEEEEGQDEDESGQEEEKKEEQKEEEMDFKDLQTQFVKGGESDEDWRLGQHQKFCISLAVTPDSKMVISGGGDDRLICYKQTQGTWAECYSLKHTESVSKVELSFDSKHVLSLTDNQLFCTDLSNFKSEKMEIVEPSDIVCHKQGGVFALTHGYSVSIYNFKGLELYTTYNMDLPAHLLTFSQNGKQLAVGCENKLRIITPKTGEIIKVAGNEFHKEQIAVLGTIGNVVLSGCIGGDVYVSGLAKGNILGHYQHFKGSINCIQVGQNYAAIAPQSDGLYWTDFNKCKKIFHSPAQISVSAMCKVHSQNHFAVADLQGTIHLLDCRAPLNIIKTVKAGNTVHALESRGSQLYAACQDGYVRIFDVNKLL